MAKQKNAKYVVDFDKPNPRFPPYRVKVDPNFVKRVVQVDADTVPGAEFYSETKWILPGSRAEIKLCESHTHAFGELLGFFGFNYDDIQDLGAEIEITIDNEKQLVTKSFAAFVPAGIQHGPVVIRNVVRPIFHVSAGPSGHYK